MSRDRGIAETAHELVSAIVGVRRKIDGGLALVNDYTEPTGLCVERDALERDVEFQLSGLITRALNLSRRLDAHHAAQEGQATR